MFLVYVPLRFNFSKCAWFNIVSTNQTVLHHHSDFYWKSFWQWHWQHKPWHHNTIFLHKVQLKCISRWKLQFLMNNFQQFWHNSHRLSQLVCTNVTVFFYKMLLIYVIYVDMARSEIQSTIFVTKKLHCFPLLLQSQSENISSSFNVSHKFILYSYKIMIKKANSFQNSIDSRL